MGRLPDESSSTACNSFPRNQKRSSAAHERSAPAKLRASTLSTPAWHGSTSGSLAFTRGFRSMATAGGNGRANWIKKRGKVAGVDRSTEFRSASRTSSISPDFPPGPARGKWPNRGRAVTRPWCASCATPARFSWARPSPRSLPALTRRPREIRGTSNARRAARRAVRQPASPRECAWVRSDRRPEDRSPAPRPIAALPVANRPTDA